MQLVLRHQVRHQEFTVAVINVAYNKFTEQHIKNFYTNFLANVDSVCIL